MDSKPKKQNSAEGKRQLYQLRKALGIPKTATHDEAALQIARDIAYDAETTSLINMLVDSIENDGIGWWVSGSHASSHSEQLDLAVRAAAGEGSSK